MTINQPTLRGPWLAATMALLTVFISGNAMAYDEPDYSVEEQGEGFEIRAYQSYLVAEVQVRESFKNAGNKAFRILFNYISGENTKAQEISMTIPVNQQPLAETSEKIDMTTPVLQSPDTAEEDIYRFSFVMPDTYTLETLPKPKDSRITIREIPAKRMAVRQYSGSWSESNYRKNETLLLEALEAKGLKTLGLPVYARYNSPFSLWFMRRNEVMVEIDS